MGVLAGTNLVVKPEGGDTSNYKQNERTRQAESGPDCLYSRHGIVCEGGHRMRLVTCGGREKTVLNSPLTALFTPGHDRHRLLVNINICMCMCVCVCVCVYVCMYVCMYAYVCT